jgi:hypothetical protein
MPLSTGIETESKRTRNSIETGSLSLTNGAALGLFYIQRYRFLTIGQYARIALLNHDTATKQLRRFEDHGLFAQFLAVCRRSKWSKHVTNSPFLALLIMVGSNAACKITSACSNALC